MVAFKQTLKYSTFFIYSSHYCICHELLISYHSQLQLLQNLPSLVKINILFRHRQDDIIHMQQTKPSQHVFKDFQKPMKKGEKG